MDASQQTQKIMGRAVFSNIMTKQLMINNGTYTTRALPTLGGRGSNTTILSQATGAIYTSPSEFDRITAFEFQPPPVVYSFGSYFFTDSMTNFGTIMIPFDSDFSFGTGDFTIEWFQNLQLNNGHVKIFTYEISPEGTLISFSINIASADSVSVQITLADVPSFVATIPNAEILDTWVHFAIVRNAGYVNIYKNGVPICPPTYLPDDLNGNGGNLYIGSGTTPEEQFTGNITSFRIVKGVSVYKTNFKPPTTALLSIPGTVLLLSPSSINQDISDVSNRKKAVNSANVIYSEPTPFSTA